MKGDEGAFHLYREQSRANWATQTDMAKDVRIPKSHLKTNNKIRLKVKE
jgi:hypothetical protein